MLSISFSSFTAKLSVFTYAPEPVASSTISTSHLAPYFTEALEELHEATFNVSQWESVLEFCVPAFRTTLVRLTEKARGPLTDLRDALKDIAYSLHEIKLRGSIPRWGMVDVDSSDSKQQAAEQISYLPSSLHFLWRYLQTDQVESNLVELEEALLHLQSIANQLQSALNSGCWHQNAVQVNKVTDSTIEGVEQCSVGNVCFGPSGTVSATCTINRAIILAPKNSNSRVNTNNRNIVLDEKNSTLAEREEALRTYVNARARQDVTRALCQAMPRIPPQYRSQMGQVARMLSVEVTA